MEGVAPVESLGSEHSTLSFLLIGSAGYQQLCLLLWKTGCFDCDAYEPETL